MAKIGSAKEVLDLSEEIGLQETELLVSTEGLFEIGLKEAATIAEITAHFDVQLSKHEQALAAVKKVHVPCGPCQSMN